MRARLGHGLSTRSWEYFSVRSGLVSREYPKFCVYGLIADGGLKNWICVK
jgi:hypothetical protein